MAAMIHEALRNSYVMQGLSEYQLSELTALAKIKDFDGGQMIVRQFAEDNDLLVVVEGAVRITAFSGELIAEAGPGAVIGEVSLVDDKPRSATVTACGPTTVVAISNEDLTNYINDDPLAGKIILLNISRILCTRLRAANVALDMVVNRQIV